MLGVLAGQKVTGLSLFAKGLWGLEKEWRKAHPEFDGKNLVMLATQVPRSASLRLRWTF